MNDMKTPSISGQAQPAPTPLRRAVSFARMLVLAQRRFRELNREAAPAKVRHQLG